MRHNYSAPKYAAPKKTVILEVEDEKEGEFNIKQYFFIIIL